MTSMLTSLFDKVSQVVTDPFSVRLVNNSAYQRKSILTINEQVYSSDNIALHDMNGYYDILLLQPNKQAQSFRLCHLPRARKKEALNFYRAVTTTLSILCKITNQCYELPKLQTICTTLRKNSSWSPAHIAVDADVAGVYKREGPLGPWLDCQLCDDHSTPLTLACKGKFEKIVKELLEADVDLTKVDDKGNTALHVAVDRGILDILKALCDHASEDALNILNGEGETALHLACKQNRFEECKVLLKAGANPQIKGRSALALHYAIKYGSRNSAEALLEADPKQVEELCAKYGALPMHWCKSSEDVNMLLKYNSPTDVASNQLHHPLHIMVQRSRLEAAVAMILGNADVNSRGKNGNTALHLAVSHDYVMLVKMLLLFGADHTLVNDFGETVGLLAVRSNKPHKEEILEMLSCIGALMVDLSTTQTDSRPLRNAQTSTSDYVDSTKGDRVLCLDGGGIRGLVLTQLLMAIEKRTGKKAKELFDWIAGTSTGGFLAIFLGQGKSAVEAQRLYFRFKDKVFSGSRPYSNDIIEEFLKSEFGEDTTIESVKHDPKVIVTATLADRKPVKLQLFRNYDTKLPAEQSPVLSKKLSTSDLKKLKQKQSFSSHGKELLWKVARCSGAAPTYFSPMDSFLDGGLVANNPTLDTLTEIHRYSKEQGDKMNVDIVVSLGTGKLPTTLARSVDVTRSTNPVTLFNSAMAGIELTQMMVDVACESNAHVVDRARAWCESIDTSYFRLNPSLEEDIFLDEKDDTVLLNLMWQSQVYIHNNSHVIEEIAQKLLRK